MTRLLLAGFLIAHGLVHPAIYATPKDPSEPPPFDPSHSWALSHTHVAAAPIHLASVALAWVAAAGYTVAGIALGLDAGVWAGIAAAAAVMGIALKSLWFNRWLTFGLAVDLGVLAVALT